MKIKFYIFRSCRLGSAWRRNVLVGQSEGSQGRFGYGDGKRTEEGRDVGARTRIHGRPLQTVSVHQTVLLGGADGRRREGHAKTLPAHQRRATPRISAVRVKRRFLPYVYFIDLLFKF